VIPHFRLRRLRILLRGSMRTQSVQSIHLRGRTLLRRRNREVRRKRRRRVCSYITIMKARLRQH
jgi:hypothetical protein